MLSKEQFEAQLREKIKNFKPENGHEALYPEGFKEQLEEAWLEQIVTMYTNTFFNSDGKIKETYYVNAMQHEIDCLFDKLNKQYQIEATKQYDQATQRGYELDELRRIELRDVLATRRRIAWRWYMGNALSRVTASEAAADADFVLKLEEDRFGPVQESP